MATYNLHRFSHPEGLKAIQPHHLVSLLTPYREYLNQRGVTLPKLQSFEDWNLEPLIQVLIHPDTDTPKTLADTLYFIHEMATPEAMDLLLEENEIGRFQLDGSDELTPADVAVQASLKNPELLERKHAEQYAKDYLHRPRSFEYFLTTRDKPPSFKSPSRQQIRDLEQSLDNWFESKKRGRGLRVFLFERDEAVWFLVRHGQPFKREGSLERGEPGSVLYRPVKYDVLVYNILLGELRINAVSRKEKDLYRVQFGLKLFGDAEIFPNTGPKYTLEPLRTDGPHALVCSDVEGIEWIFLTEVRFAWGGPENEVESRRANNVFLSYYWNK